MYVYIYISCVQCAAATGRIWRTCCFCVEAAMRGVRASDACTQHKQAHALETRKHNTDEIAASVFGILNTSGIARLASTTSGAFVCVCLIDIDNNPISARNVY